MKKNLPQPSFKQIQFQPPTTNQPNLVNKTLNQNCNINNKNAIHHTFKNDQESIELLLKPDHQKQIRYCFKKDLVGKMGKYRYRTACGDTQAFIKQKQLEKAIAAEDLQLHGTKVNALEHKFAHLDHTRRQNIIQNSKSKEIIKPEIVIQIPDIQCIKSNELLQYPRIVNQKQQNISRVVSNKKIKLDIKHQTNFIYKVTENEKVKYKTSYKIKGQKRKGKQKEGQKQKQQDRQQYNCSFLKPKYATLSAQPNSPKKIQSSLKNNPLVVPRALNQYQSNNPEQKLDSYFETSLRTYLTQQSVYKLDQKQDLISSIKKRKPKTPIRQFVLTNRMVSKKIRLLLQELDQTSVNNMKKADGSQDEINEINVETTDVFEENIDQSNIDYSIQEKAHKTMNNLSSNKNIKIVVKSKNKQKQKNKKNKDIGIKTFTKLSKVHQLQTMPIETGPTAPISSPLANHCRPQQQIHHITINIQNAQKQRMFYRQRLKQYCSVFAKGHQKLWQNQEDYLFRNYYISSYTFKNTSKRGTHQRYRTIF